MEECTEIELYNGRKTEIRTKNLKILHGKLNILSSLLKNLPIIAENYMVWDIAFYIGQVIGKINLSDICNRTGLPMIGDNKLDPLRSFGYYGFGAYILQNPTIDGESRRLFAETKNYFRDAFIVQSAWLIDSQEPNGRFPYLGKLDSELRIIEKEYAGKINEQSKGWDLFRTKN